MLPDPSADGAEHPRSSHFRFPLARHPLVAHGLGLLAAAVLASLLGWLILQGYRQPGLLIDIANGMMLC